MAKRGGTEVKNLCSPGRAQGVLAMLVLTAGLVKPGFAPAAVLFGDDRELLTIQNQMSFRSWRVTDNDTNQARTVRQASNRLLSSFTLGPSADLVFYGSAAVSQDRAASVAELDGLGDAKLKGFVHAWQRRLILSAGVNLPTGQTALEENEIRAAAAVAPHVFGFRMKNYGGGFDLDLGAAVGFDAKENVTVGGGASFLLRGEYDLDQVSQYKPGSEIALTAGADVRTDRSRTTLDAVVRVFMTDQIDGTDSFEEGTQFEFNLVTSFQGATWGVDLGVKDIVKLDNELLTVTSPGEDNRVSNGNNLWLSATPRYQPNEDFAILFPFDLIAVNQSQQQNTSAWAAGFGLGLEGRLTPVAIIQARVAKLTGGSENDVVDISGWDGVISLRWQY